MIGPTADAASWATFEHEAAEMASAGRLLIDRHELMILATTRRDRSPRVHPVVPVFAEGRLFVALADWSPKWRDLARDGRCVLHAIPGGREDEFVLRCQARAADDASALVVAAAAHLIHDTDHIFEFDLEQVDFGYWENVGRPDMFAVRHRWTPDGVTQLKGAPEGSAW